MPCLFVALIPWGYMAFATRLASLKKLYPEQFQEHAIDSQSRFSKESILYYSFFLEALRKEGYTASKVRELSSYADLIGSSSGPALAQNLGFVSLITFMIALSTEVIKSFSNFASGMGVELIAIGLVVANFYWMVWGGRSWPFLRASESETLSRVGGSRSSLKRMEIDACPLHP